MVVILLFIIILNIVSIVLMYYCLGDLEKKEKLIFIAAGTAVMYMLTSIIYWISTRNVEISEVSETGKELITFLFVPINGILVLPLFAKSYYSFKQGRISGNILKNRGVALGIILLIVLIIECVYFKNIQEQVVNLVIERQNATQKQETIQSNQLNGTNEVQEDQSNELSETNQIQEDVQSNELSQNSINTLEGENQVVNETLQ